MASLLQTEANDTSIDRGLFIHTKLESYQWENVMAFELYTEIYQ